MYKHKLLIANPMINDPVFAGSVIFLFEHSGKGAQGIILNAKEVGKVGFGMMQDLFNAAPGNFNEAKDMILNGKLQSVPLFMGGPCQTPSLFFLHAYEEFLNIHEGSGEEKSEYDLGIPSSFNLHDEDEPPAYSDESPFPKLSITEGLYFGSPFTFGNIIEAGKLHENKFKFFTGLSAWGAGQLENEILNGAWTIADPTPDVFFDNDELKRLSEKAAKAAPVAEVPPPPASSSEKPAYPWMPPTPPGFDPTRN